MLFCFTRHCTIRYTALSICGLNPALRILLIKKKLLRKDFFLFFLHTHLSLISEVYENISRKRNLTLLKSFQPQNSD